MDTEEQEIVENIITVDDAYVFWRKEYDDDQVSYHTTDSIRHFTYRHSVFKIRGLSWNSNDYEIIGQSTDDTEFPNGSDPDIGRQEIIVYYSNIKREKFITYYAYHNVFDSTPRTSLTYKKAAMIVLNEIDLITAVYKLHRIFGGSKRYRDKNGQYRNRWIPYIPDLVRNNLINTLEPLEI